jgi:hypothetical protein
MLRTAVIPTNINPDKSQGFILAVDGCFPSVSYELKSIRYYDDLLAEE